MARRAENVVAFYNKRGTCEQWIKEFSTTKAFPTEAKSRSGSKRPLRDKSKFGRGGKIPRRDHHLPIGGLPIMFYNSFHCSAPALSRTLGRK